MTFVTRRFQSLLILITLACTMGQAQAATSTQREVGQLLDRMARSDCKFNRNGKWYDASAARDHLQKKYDYLEKRNLAPDTESFIQRAASTSSMTGTPYQVRCGDKPPTSAGAWLNAELQRFRSAPSIPLTR
jgi:hypothetical protein